MEAMDNLRLREAARVIVLDENARVLLLRYDEQGGFWATPGGGVEPGEATEAAALRETHEELGIRLLVAGPAVAVRTKELQFGNERVRQTETYYLATVAADSIDLTPANHPDTIRERRWWTVDELTRTDATVYPTGLANVISRYLVNGVPTKPITLTG
ncbi:NUDIX hydrolase [Uniformispora flossi]|uniref:NUDIX hydrolase n=1 Tax=Uniformispora flossi TaxID=3390723 RepID=UPI003C2D238A